MRRRIMILTGQNIVGMSADEILTWTQQTSYAKDVIDIRNAFLLHGRQLRRR
jgi:hypothetical protein